eukprot:1358848-Prymnesium_polylepis.1
MGAQLGASADRSGCVPSHGSCVASEGGAVGCGGDGAAPVTVHGGSAAERHTTRGEGYVDMASGPGMRLQ